MKAHMTLRRVALAVALGGVSIAPEPLVAQGPEGRWPLQPRTEIGRVVAPFLEGWYANEDGTFTYSFGYSNLNGDTVEIPLGDKNRIEPAEFHGMQPSVFLPGRHRGMFGVTVPSSIREDDVWWTITNPDGEVTKVPGRTRWTAYMLDWFPRPHGSLPPMVSFDDGSGAEGRGPPGIVSRRTLAASVGEPLEVVVEVRDPSERDRTDARFREPIALRVVWSMYQGPTGGQVAFTRHPSTPIPEPPAGRAGRGGQADAGGAGGAGAGGPAGRGTGAGGGGGGGGGLGAGPAGPETIMVSSGAGTVRVLATFSAPGEYMLNAQVDNWRTPDSGSGDQCCWTNGYVRIAVR